MSQLKIQRSNESITRIIHWTMAILIIALLVLGFYMKSNEAYGFYPLHKSLGVIALLAIFLRLYWRITRPWQSSVTNSQHYKWIKLAHLSVLALLVLMPLTGFMLSGLGGHGVAMFGVEIIPTNYNADGKAVPFNALLSDIGYIAHEIFAIALSALLILHVLAALKHHYIDKDNTLKRMLGRV